MRAAGLVLITVGFLVGSLSAVTDPAAVNWSWFVPGFLAGALGVALARFGSHKQATSKETLESDIKDIDESLAEIVEQVRALRDAKEDIDVYDLPDRIEQRLHEPINRFVEARQSLVHVYGLDIYADVMSMFAAGERYINRVWSAAAEGYIDEAHTYIDKSCTQFDGALAKVEEARGAVGVAEAEPA